jgi:hypothetical protein
LATILKMADISKILKRRIAPLMVTYHHHNTAQIQHCPISMPFHMWVDYDVPNWFLTSKNFYWLPFSKWPPQYRTNSTLFDFNILNWFPTLKNFYQITLKPNWPPLIVLKTTQLQDKSD